jgi:hypothetical protein
MFADYPFPPVETAFFESPPALLWIGTVEAQWMLWFVLVPPFVAGMVVFAPLAGSLVSLLLPGVSI